MGIAADFSREQAVFDTGTSLVAGIDEAGRGPLAGPVVAAAVILDPGRIPDGLADSKALSAARREALFDAIVATAGRDLPGCPCPGDAVIDGDALCVSIAAASIIAKVTRDRMMDRLATAHPNYGFQTNRGYGTAQHLDALSRIGPCSIHRMTFRPLSQGSLFTS
jgi:ribonuclease HII